MPKKLSLMIARLGPLDIPLRYGGDPRDGLLGVVIGQQVSSRAAAAIRARVFSAFPDRAALYRAARAGELTDLGLSQSKQKTIQFISLIADSEIDRWRFLPYAQRLETMTKVTGIGPWTVAMWSMFVCRDPDCWSQGDLILRTRLAALSDDTGLSSAELLTMARPFRTYLALALWALKDQIPRDKTIP